MVVIIFWLIILLFIFSSQTRKKTRLKKEAQRNYRQGSFQQGNFQQRNPMQGNAMQQRVLTDADRARLEAYRVQKAATQQKAYRVQQPANQELSANRQRAMMQPDIVERAKENSARYQQDRTMQELEQRHKHSERVAPAVAAYVREESTGHPYIHNGNTSDTEEISLLGSVEDLMVKGYEGKLSFERDFIGEALDLLNSFTMVN